MNRLGSARSDKGVANLRGPALLRLAVYSIAGAALVAFATACGGGGEPEPSSTATAEASPTAGELPTPEPTAAAEPTPTVEPTPEVVDEHPGWLTYTNDIYGYEFRYPPGATVAEAEEVAFSISPDEAADGVTIHDVYETYTGKICVQVDYDLGYVTISAPANEGFRYVICGRTGRAYEGPDREETLIIDGTTYTAQGFEEQGPGDTLPFHNEMLTVQLADGTRIEYGPKPVETATFADYLAMRDDLLGIAQSYRAIP